MVTYYKNNTVVVREKVKDGIETTQWMAREVVNDGTEIQCRISEMVNDVTETTKMKGEGR